MQTSHARIPVVTSSDLTTAQAEKIKAVVGRQLRYLNNLCARIDRLQWPVNDPLRLAAQEARKMTQDLLTAGHYAGVKSGVGERPGK